MVLMSEIYIYASALRSSQEAASSPYGATEARPFSW